LWGGAVGQQRGGCSPSRRGLVKIDGGKAHTGPPVCNGLPIITRGRHYTPPQPVEVHKPRPPPHPRGPPSKKKPQTGRPFQPTPPRLGGGEGVLTETCARPQVSAAQGTGPGATAQWSSADSKGKPHGKAEQRARWNPMEADGWTFPHPPPANPRGSLTRPHPLWTADRRPAGRRGRGRQRPQHGGKPSTCRTAPPSPSGLDPGPPRATPFPVSFLCFT